jgi:hypothetical protein
MLLQQAREFGAQRLVLGTVACLNHRICLVELASAIAAGHG